MPATASSAVVDKYHVAIHEAGHAVVALHYGFKPHERRAVTLDGTEFDSTNFDLIHGAVVSMAGVAAEWVHTDGTGILIVGADHDFDVAAQALGFPNVEALPDRLVRRLVLQARAILTERWKVVVAMADALAERGALDGAEVLAIFRSGE